MKRDTVDMAAIGVLESLELLVRWHQAVEKSPYNNVPDKEQIEDMYEHFSHNVDMAFLHYTDTIHNACMGVDDKPAKKSGRASE